jgi:hypothetical protein
VSGLARDRVPPTLAPRTRSGGWPTRGPLLSAVTLRGLQPFTIRVPNRLVARTCSPNDYSTCVAQIALTNHRLYLLKASTSYPEQLWAAPSPLPPKRQHK